jgi:hypothetical protein
MRNQEVLGLNMVVKRKLVRSYGSGCRATQPLPKEYENARLRWLGRVRVEADSGLVDEYEIEPDGKLYLNDFLTLIAEEIEKFDEIDDADWRVDIYKLTRRQRC